MSAASDDYEQLPLEDDTDIDIGTPFTDYFNSVVTDCAVDTAGDDTVPANVTLSKPSFSQVFVATLLTLCSVFETTVYCCSELSV